MARRHHWEYADASNSSVGLMICTACRKPIEEGEYRYRETEEAYLPQHRVCSEGDAGWAALDKASADRKDRAERRLAAAQSFVREWGVTDLNDILDASAA